MYKEQFNKDLLEYLLSKNISVKINLSYSDFEDFQYQTSVALSNKAINAQDLMSFLMTKPWYEKVQVTGPGFVSVKFKLQELENKSVSVKSKQRILVDYCGVNVAKKMHIGHIRSMFIGDYIVRLHEKNGDDVIKVNHIGDWGNQFGYLLHYIQKNKLESSLDNQKLTEYYKLANLLNKEDPVFAKESELVAYNLQNGLDKKLHNLWEKCVKISMEDAEKTFSELDIKMNLSDTQGESFYAPLCKDILNDLLNKNIAQKSDGDSVVVFFENKSPLVLQKSNGNFLYALYDLAALKWRQENINPNKIVYVVDKRQALHFDQVFEIAKKAGYVNNDVVLQHVGFGTILGKDKKPLKTKSGESLYLEDLLNEGKNILLNSSYFQTLENEIKDEILEKNIIGGMKFYDLKFNKNQDYIFDWQFVLNFSGGSAPYIQNAMARIDSIGDKIGIDMEIKSSFIFENNWSDEEKLIIFQTQKCNEIVQDSIDDYSSQILTENIIKLCQLFHSYYEGEMIIGNKEQDKKINLLNHVYHSLKENIDILGIGYYNCKSKLLNLNIKKKVKWLTQKQILKKLEINKKSLNKQLINLDLKDSKTKLITTKAIEKEFAKIDCNKISWNEKIISILDETIPLEERVGELISLIKKLSKIINNYNKNPENEKLYRFLWEESFDKTERKYLLIKKNKKILGYLLVKLEEYELLNFFDGYIAEKDIELNKILLLKYKLEQTFLKSNKNMNVKI